MKNRVELAELVSARIAAEAWRHKKEVKSTVVGICGSQGSGKSTMSAELKALLEQQGLRVALLSLDDLYLTRAARGRLSDEVHPLLKTRGVPGTHDIPLALQVFDALRRPGIVALPSFEKAIDDRRLESEWESVQSPVDVILFEGWCVGASAEKDEALMAPVNALERDEDQEGVWRRYANEKLAREYQELFRQIDVLILLAAPSFDVVYRWRLQQENELRKKVVAEGEDTSRLMSDPQLERFVSHYERLTRHILAEVPSRADIVVRLDDERRGKVE